jgi:hypothetical protein
VTTFTLRIIQETSDFFLDLWHLSEQVSVHNLRCLWGYHRSSCSCYSCISMLGTVCWQTYFLTSLGWCDKYWLKFKLSLQLSLPSDDQSTHPSVPIRHCPYYEMLQAIQSMGHPPSSDHSQPWTCE